MFEDTKSYVKGDYFSIDYITNTESGEHTQRKMYEVLENCELKDVITFDEALSSGKIKYIKYNGG